MALGDESCRQPLNPEPVTCKRDAKAVPTSRKAARDWKIRGLCPSRVTRPTSPLAADLPGPWVICLCPVVADFPDGCYSRCGLEPAVVQRLWTERGRAREDPWPMPVYGGLIDSLSLRLCCRSRGMICLCPEVADFPDGC